MISTVSSSGCASNRDRTIWNSRLAEYDDLSVDVMIHPDHTTTYRGDLIRNQ